MRVIASTGVVAVLLTAAAVVRGEGAGVRDYVDGLGALGAGEWEEAEGKFAKAIDADEENADYYVARGVARVFGERLEKGEEDFRRAMKLRPGDREAGMWAACAVTMRGELARQAEDAPFVRPDDEYFNTIRMGTFPYGRGAFLQRRTTEEGNVSAEDVAGWKVEGRALQEKARGRFVEFARMYVEKVERTSPQLAGLLRERAKGALAGGDAAGAARAYERIRQADPEDARSLLDHARAALAAGAPAVARRELTLFLIAEPKHAGAYVLRARAAAVMGDGRRARGDLETARSFDAAVAEGARGDVERLVKENEARLPPGEWWTEIEALREAARDAETRELVGRASRLVRAVNNERVVAEEVYQDQLLALWRRVWGNERGAGGYAALGDFLYRNAIDPRGEAVGPRDEFRTYRTMTERSRKRELDAAAWCAEEGLRRDGNHVHSMAVKAAVLVQRRQWGDAEQLLKRAMGIKGDEPRVLVLMAAVLDHAASVRAARAFDLRQVTQWEDMTYIYTRRPSQTELAEAGQLDAQAERLWALSREQMGRAAVARQGTAEGAYLRALLARRDGDKAGAVRAMEEAVRLEPGRVEYRDLMGTMYAEVGEQERSFREKFAAANLAQTTAGPLLRVAWSQIPLTKFATARKLLEGAMATDPADPRGAAYMAVVAPAKGDEEADLAWTRVAQAIQLANAAFDGPTAAVPATGEDVALAVAMGVRAGDVLLKRGKVAEAIGAYDVAIEQFGRVERAGQWARVARGMLPSPETEQGRIPEALPLVVHGGWARVGRGRALAAMNRLPEARRELEEAAGYLANRPPTVNAGSTLEPMACAAGLELVDVSLKEGRVAEARERLRKFTLQGGVWPGLTGRYEELVSKVGDAPAEARGTPTDRAFIERLRRGR